MIMSSISVNPGDSIAYACGAGGSGGGGGGFGGAKGGDGADGFVVVMY